eukprot:TRINITY_DN29746_c0_g2_i2.p1 TRINITY_DN29746_c0_g2~~TRINITY_DN29746_c0_g2_i2.p1  ORF type:complete len:409 (+),score=81.14 TRINITY_DN29746_c0_g2_i2:84-1229(+)
MAHKTPPYDPKGQGEREYKKFASDNRHYWAMGKPDGARVLCAPPDAKGCCRFMKWEEFLPQLSEGERTRRWDLLPLEFLFSKDNAPPGALYLETDHPDFPSGPEEPYILHFGRVVGPTEQQNRAGLINGWPYWVHWKRPPRYYIYMGAEGWELARNGMFACRREGRERDQPLIRAYPSETWQDFQRWPNDVGCWDVVDYRSQGGAAPGARIRAYAPGFTIGRCPFLSDDLGSDRVSSGGPASPRGQLLTPRAASHRSPSRSWAPPPAAAEAGSWAPAAAGRGGGAPPQFAGAADGQHMGKGASYPGRGQPAAVWEHAAAAASPGGPQGRGWGLEPNGPPGGGWHPAAVGGCRRCRECCPLSCAPPVPASTSRRSCSAGVTR